MRLVKRQDDTFNRYYFLLFILLMKPSHILNRRSVDDDETYGR